MTSPEQGKGRRPRPGRLLRPVAGGRSRRSRSGLFSWVRLLGALMMLGASLGLNWLAAPERFQLEPARVEIRGLAHTAEDTARAALALGDSRPNLFRLRTVPLVHALEALPAVARVEAHVGLPDHLTLVVVERVPVMVWQSGGRRVLVDAAGIAISEATLGEAQLPLVSDGRSAAAPLAPGDQLDSIDLAAALKLAALTPATLDSSAGSLSLAIDDENGFTIVAAAPAAWRAVFGHYTPNLRTVDMIDAQVQCLRSLLAAREAQMAVIYLAPSEDRCGTFRARPTPRARIFHNGQRSG